MSGMLILTLPFHVFFLVPKGVILPVEGSPHSSAGLHSLTSQSERGGLRSPAPTWTRLAPSCPPPSVPARFPSSHLYKQATLRVVACSWVTKSWMGKRGTPLQLVRHRGPSAVLPVPPVRLLCLWLVLKAPALALIAPPLLPQRKPLPLLKWNSDRISIGKPFPALWKSTAAAQTLMRLDRSMLKPDENSAQHPAKVEHTGTGTTGLKAAGQREAQGRCQGQTNLVFEGANCSLAANGPSCRASGTGSARPSASWLD